MSAEQGSTPKPQENEKVEEKKGEDKTMLAVQLYGAMSSGIREFTADELKQRIKLERIPIPTPRSGQVLIKVARSAILPMNLSELKKTYGTWNKDGADKPIQCGSEGCGVVVASGGGFFPWRLVGKRVAFFRYNAAWAEYAVVNYTQVMEIGDLDFDKAVSAFANPFTVMSFIEIAQTAGVKTIIHTAAASALGLMLIRHAKRQGINVIAVVRRDSQAQECLQAGALAALDSTKDDFRAKLQELTTKHKATVAFDAVAGQLTGDVLSAMPNGSKIYVYGGLSEDRPVISTRDLIFKKKSVEGFWLKDYAASKYSLGLLQWSMTVARYLDTDFASKVQSKKPLGDIHDAILAYSKNMGAGKVIIDCDNQKK